MEIEQFRRTAFGLVHAVVVASFFVAAPLHAQFARWGADPSDQVVKCSWQSGDASEIDRRADYNRGKTLVPHVITDCPSDMVIIRANPRGYGYEIEFEYVMPNNVFTVTKWEPESCTMVAFPDMCSRLTNENTPFPSGSKVQQYLCEKGPYSRSFTSDRKEVEVPDRRYWTCAIRGDVTIELKYKPRQSSSSAVDAQGALNSQSGAFRATARAYRVAAKWSRQVPNERAARCYERQAAFHDARADQLSTNGGDQPAPQNPGDPGECAARPGEPTLSPQQVAAMQKEMASVTPDGSNSTGDPPDVTRASSGESSTASQTETALGDTTSKLSWLALQSGMEAYRKAAASKTPEDFAAAVDALKYADSVAPITLKEQAQFLIGATYVQFGYVKLSASEAAKSCTLVKEAKDLFVEAQFLLPKGKSYAPEQMRSLMGAVMQLDPIADARLKVYCK